MKKITLSLVILTIAITVIAQTPQAFKYQAVVRDNAGEILANQSVSFRLSIRDGSAGGTIVYQETQAAVTNQFGLANLEIGNGPTTIGSFILIDWSSGSKYLQIELDPAGGVSYISMGTTQLLSVPFALHAETSENTFWEQNRVICSSYLLRAMFASSPCRLTRTRQNSSELIPGH